MKTPEHMLPWCNNQIKQVIRLQYCEIWTVEKRAEPGDFISQFNLIILYSKSFNPSLLPQAM